jgi:hypothetical protein
VTDVLSVLAAMAFTLGTVLQRHRALDSSAVLISHVIRVSGGKSSLAAQGRG